MGALPSQVNPATPSSVVNVSLPLRFTLNAEMEEEPALVVNAVRPLADVTTQQAAVSVVGTAEASTLKEPLS